MKNAYEISTWIDEFGESQVNLTKLKEYLDFLVTCTYDSEDYTEWHHIIPRCIDKSRQYTTAIIRLRGADHFRAHIKLVEIFSGRLRCTLTYPLNRMKKHCDSPEDYEKSRKLFSDSQLGVNNPASCKEVRIKISQSRKGKYIITNGTLEKLVSPDEPIPPGWRRGLSESHRLNSGHRGYQHSDETRFVMSQKRTNGNLGRRWVTNGEINSTIKAEDEIPEGWRLGRVVSDCTREKNRQASSGRIAINNGTSMKFISSVEEIPEGYSLGRLPTTSGKIRITNGKSNRCILCSEEIPEGWWRGMTRNL